MREKHDDSKEDYGSPKQGQVPNFAGYPNNVKNTQTTKFRGAGCATKGNKFSGRVA